MSGEGDSGDSSSDYSAKPSTSANSRRITRSSRNASASASCSSSTRGAAGVSNGGGSKKKRRIVMRIEFDDDSDESSSTSNSSGMSDDASNEKQISNSRTTNNSIKAHNEHDDDEIKPCASSNRRVRGKLGKKSNLVFNSDDNEDSEDDVPVGGIRRRNRRNRQKLEDEDDAEEEGVFRNGREISRNIQNDNSANVSQNRIPTLSTLQQQDENGFNSDSSSNELLEKCPICLLSFRAQEIGSPATCQHIFCANCIEAWSKNVQTCPIDRIEFDRIVVRESFENRAVLREINVCKADCVDKINVSDDDVTHCEVCNRPDREEVMLLCDSCNQGYHIDCLTPPLNEIPEGSWYCDNCFDSENEDSDMVDDLNELYADIRDMGIPETRLRVTEVHQPRILRTRQNERIRAAIISRTRASTRNQIQNVDAAPSTSRTASTSSRSTRTVRNSSRTAARVPKTRRRRRRRARQRTYVVEYDLNNFDEKFAIKTTKRVIRRRRRKRTQRRALSQRQLEILGGGRQTASKRLAEQLGVKSTNREARAAASSHTFSLFGNANDLEYFSDSDSGVIDNEIEISTGGGGGGPTAVQTSVRVSSYRTHRGKKGLLSRLEREPPSSTPDLLSNIMDLQDRWHNASRHMDAVRIGQDGSLNLPPSSATDGPRSAARNESVLGTAAPTTTTTQPSNIQITQAPMYSRGGGNNNRNFNSGGGGAGGNSGGGNYNNRYNNQSMYRGGGGGGGAGGSNYHNNFSSGSGNTGSGLSGAGNLFNMVGRGNFSFSSQSNNNDNPNNNNNNNSNNRDRFNQRNNNNRNNQRNSLPLSNNNNQSNDNMITMNQSPLQQHRQQNRPNMTIQNAQSIQPLGPQYSNSQQQNLGMVSNTPLQQPPPFPCSLPPPQQMFGPHNQPMQPILTQPPPSMFPMLQQQPPPLVAPVIPPLMGNPISAPPLPAPPAFNSSLFQLTADYDNDEDDDSNCPNFSVYSMESLQVAKSDVRTAAESKGETPKEDDENEDLVQLSDDEEATGTNKDDDDEGEIPLPPTPSIDKNASEQNKSSDLYEPDQPTYESDDENEYDVASNAENNPSIDDEQNKDHSNNEIESQPSVENDMEIESQDSTTEKKVSSERSQVDENEEAEVEKCSEDVQSQSAIIKSQDESKKKRSTPRKGVLELYDDSDWEELNMERPNVDDYQIRTPPLEPKSTEINEELVEKSDKDDREDKDEEEDEDDGNMTPTQPRPSSSMAEGPVVNENIKGDKDKEEDGDENEDEDGDGEDKEQDRSYTPCLDEKDEEENDGACTPELADPSAGENNPEEESHTPDHAAATKDNAGIAGMETELISEDDDSDKRDKNKRGKGAKDKEQFKKVSKNQKDRNYRTEKSLNENRRKSRSRRRRSRSRTNDKENNGFYRRGAQRGGRFKRREIPRYNVRNVVNHQRSFKDRYGRDTSRPARSTSRNRRRRSFSKSVSRSKSRSISGSPPKKRSRRSFSMSPTPPRQNIQRRQSMSPRRRSRSPIRRSPIRRNSRTPLRMRSHSNSPPRRNKHKPKKVKRSLTPVNRTRSLSRFTPRLSQSRTPPRHKNVKRPKDRNKKKKKKRQASPSPQPQSPWPREPLRRESMPPTKRKRHHTPKGKSPVVDQGWSPSPSPQRPYLHENISWTPPLSFPAGISHLHRNDEYNEFPIPSKPPKEKKKREKKKKKNEKRRQENSRNKEKRRREPGVLSQAAPSKEVFASGSNILVSVSFNKDGTQPQQHTVVTLPPTREEVLAGIRGRSKDRQAEQQGKKKRRKDGRKRKKNDMKPIAIIDLERSPFQVMQEPTDVIVLTDSEGNGQDDDENLNVSRESGNAMMTEMDHHEGSSHRSANIDKTPPLDRLQAIMEESYENAIQQQGPKTPPEPQGGIKFNLINKNKQKQMRNVLHDTEELESDENHEEEGPEDRDPMQQNAVKIGPNTPPESGPCSPDVYDPFDPTKSPSMSPRSPTPPLDVSQHESAPENDKHSTEDLRSETRMTASSGGPVAPEKNTLNPVDLVMALMNTKANSSQDLANKSNESQYSSNQVVNLLDENEKPEENNSNLGITILSNVIYATGKNQHIPIISSPPLSKSSSNKPPPKVTNILSNLPGLGNRHNGDGDGVINEIESPYSPGSADYEDLFEPPPDTNGNTKRRRGDKRGGKKEGDVFENLFGSSPPNQFVRSNARKYKPGVASARNKNKMIVKVQKIPGNNNDEHVKVYDDLPNSAVELQVKDKFLRKLNRQERVVEEVKMILKPRFNKKQISKDDYKEIMRRAVPKICHSKSGEINPKKIKNLIEAYVKKFRQKHRKLNIPNTGQVSSAVKCAAYLKKL